MSKSVRIFKKSFKVILWTAISLVFLFVIMALLIQIPAIQTKIVGYASTFVSNKTHTKVEIKKISITFPKSVVIEGLFLEDVNKDTLIYAGKVKANIAFNGLFNNKIHVRSFALEDVNLNLKRAATDSLFNFNFLLDAFSDTNKKSEVDTGTKSNWTFAVDQVRMKNIRLHYDDDYAGMNVAVNLKLIKLKMDQIDLEKSIFSIDELLVENLITSVLMKKPGNTIEDTTASVLPTITANKIEINHSMVKFTDSVGKQSVNADINQLKLKDASVDLQKEIVSLADLSLSKSKVYYFKSDNNLPDTTDNSTDSSDWKVSVKHIDLDDNLLSYRVANKPEIKNSFDANYLYYNHLTLKANNIYYSKAKTEASIEKFSAIDQNNFSITEFETDFSMNEHSIIAKNFKAITTNSSIDADLQIQFSSLESLQDSMESMILNLNLKNVRISNSDILYFSPDLIKQDFFKNRSNLTTISGLVNGSMKNLTGKNIVVKTGVNTILKTNFSIAGLPDVETANFVFPNLTLSTGKSDIKMIAGAAIPNSIEIPEKISMAIAFKGQMKSFVSTLTMNSSYGSAHLLASIDKNENFSSNVSITNFDLGSLLKDKAMFGPVSLTAEVSGHGLEQKTIKAKIKAEVSRIYLNKYTYHNLSLNGIVSDEKFDGKVSLNDENAVFNFDGLVNFSPGQESFKFNMNVVGADLQKLNLTTEDMRIAMNLDADIKGASVNDLNGTAGITNIIVVQRGEIYKLDSLLLTSVNEPNKSEITVSSALIDLKYSGIVSPAFLPNGLMNFISNYFPISDSNQISNNTELSDFNFEIQLYNHPILSEVLIPQLTEFEPGLISGSYDALTNNLKLNAEIFKIVYNGNEINDFVVDINSNPNTLNYNVSCYKISNSQINLDNFLLDGKVADQTIFAFISSIDEKQYKKLLIRSKITKNNSNYKLALDPKDFYLMNNRWDIAADNYIEFGKQGFLIHHLFISNTESQINIASVHDQFNDDLNIEIKNFKIDNISQIIEKDTNLVKGNIDGNVLLKRVNNTYGIIADASISELIVRNVPIGNLVVKAENPKAEKYDIDVKLSGPDNNLSAEGFYIPNGGDNSINLKAEIQSLSMKTVEAFSMGQISEATGNLTGNFLVQGSTAATEITGELVFNEAFLKPAFLNNTLQLKHETIQLKKDGIYFKSFTLLDADLHTAIIDGVVKMKQFSDFVFALHVNTEDFLLFNTSAQDNKEFYGKMIIDSKIDIDGPLSLPVVDAKIKLKKGSNFTFAIPETMLTTDRGEDVVEFADSIQLNSILERNLSKENQKSALTGFDISSIIEIDKQATLKLLMDPASTDSLVVRGEAALNFTIDRSGKMSLTGAYNLNDGSYLVSLESVLKRRFDIDPGSTIIWNGDPLDADININAIYLVRASPIDLLADQMEGLSEADKNSFKQRYPFLVVLKLRDQLLQPQISFEIQLRPEDKGILGGVVNTKLSLLNEDESALNKQVFALLVLGRFIQENPLQTDANNGASTVVRTTVGKFLSAQLNQLSSKMIPGVEVNFDIQSYDDYESGEAEGRTEVDIGLKKQLFNERLTVQVGGSVDVEGAKAKQNSASDITGDVTIEYSLTKDGRYRLKGFRHNQYAGAIEGQLVETGVGVSYVRDFNSWREFFKSPKEKNDSMKKN